MYCHLASSDSTEKLRVVLDHDVNIDDDNDDDDVDEQVRSFMSHCADAAANDVIVLLLLGHVIMTSLRSDS